MKLENLRIADLTPDPQNARQHDDKNLKAIMGSLKEFGQRKPIVITEAGTIVAGNGTVEAAKRLGWLDIEVVKVPSDWTDAQVKAFAIADNRTAELANWNQEVLTSQLLELEAEGWELAEFGFEAFELPDEDKPIIQDEIPESAPGRVALGDVWQLGEHRVMCGDSTKEQDVKKLMNGKTAALLHADPPYGMGKEEDGVLNDNLYGEKLDEFQMKWWNASRRFIHDNSSVYVWGNAPDLWRLWYQGGLEKSEPLTLRNEIVWTKYIEGHTKPTKIEMMRSYVNYTERCLFFMVGQQGFNNNSDNYWEGWEPVRLYLVAEMEKMSWGKSDINKITKTQMASHWFSKSQWGLIKKENYEQLQNEAAGKAFTKNYSELRAEHDQLKYGNKEVVESFYASRAYFDNTHDNMTDVWILKAVGKEDRHGHATPKPIELMARVIKSSLPKGGLCYEPFAGSGSTLIGAEQTGRVCYTMELTPEYCDIILTRWEKLTGQKAELLPAKAD
jgi:DNA modification methylase